MFVLASGSPRRRELLASLGVQFIVIRSDIDETQRAGEDPYAYAARLSQEKAAVVADRLETDDAVIAAADTIVVVAADTVGALDGGEILGKPVDAADARRMLVRLREGDHIVCTALTVLRLERGARTAITELTRTRVTMRPYTDAEIEAYIASGDPFDKAGGYAIQHPEFAPVATLDGSYTNVVGLPVETLTALLTRLGVNLPTSADPSP